LVSDIPRNKETPSRDYLLVPQTCPGNSRLKDSIRSVMSVVIALLGLSGCATFAPPVPLITFGGPKTAAPQHWELGMGVGSGAMAFKDSFGGGSGYIARWRTGLSNKLDVGIDVMGVEHGGNGTFTFKPAVRYQAADHIRVEASVGAADDSEGKSIGGDLGFVVGTTREHAPWNFYGALRFAGSLGFNDKNHRTAQPGENEPPSDAGFGLLSVGSSAKISPSSQFITEGGFGLVYVSGTKMYGQIMYISVGVLFDIARKR
jgi:hypothetical protein